MTDEPPTDDPPPLPEVFREEIDAEKLSALFTDVELAAELISVTLKRGAQAHADEGEVTLERARELLLSGAVTGAQLRYRHEGREWWDTVLRTAEGFTVVRIEQRFGR